MSKEITLKEDNFDLIADVEMLKNAAQKLMQTPHYAKLGQEGVFAIVQKAKSLNISPLDALNGSLYYLNGRTAMSSEMMNTLIRSNGHSITKDPKSDDKICILHGRRCDNGDTWTESFSIEDAKRAGIYKNVWEKYPRNMCFNRALSNLARQLFPDVIKGCYEIEELKSFAEASPINYQRPAEVEIQDVEMSQEEIARFYTNFNGDEEMTRAYVKMYMSKKNYSESKVISGLQVDLEAAHKAYTSWKKKQKPKVEAIEVVAAPGTEIVVAPAMEPVSIFAEEVK